MLTSQEAAKDFRKHGLKTILFSAVAVGGFYGLVDIKSEMDEKKEAAAIIAADEAAARFDATANFLLSSSNTIDTSNITETDSILGDCLAQQSPAKRTVLRNGTLSVAAENTPLDTPKLRACYINAASEQRREAVSSSADNVAKSVAGAIVTAITIMSAGLAAGNTAGTAFSGGAFLYRRRREEKEKAASAATETSLSLK